MKFIFIKYLGFTFTIFILNFMRILMLTQIILRKCTARIFLDFCEKYQNHIPLNYYTNIKSLKHLSYRAVVPRLPVYFSNARMFYRRACIYLLVRFPIPHGPTHITFARKRRRRSYDVQLKSSLPRRSPFFRCHSVVVLGARAKQFTWVNSWLQLCFLPVPTTTRLSTQYWYQYNFDESKLQWISKKKTNKA